MCLRLGILFIALHLTCIVQAQKDSVLLKPVTIYGFPEEKYLAGSKIEKVDSSLQHIYNSSHLGEVLSLQFPIYFRNYGNGMLSGISMRGTSPQHTAVLWNGININSFSLGQADFSILPAVAFDEVKVHSGGGSSRFGSGAFGGTVLLETVSEKNPLLLFRQEIGSFGKYHSAIKTSFYARDFIFTSSLYRVESENDFPIHKTGKRQHHAEFLQQGFVQNIQYHFSRTQLLKLDYWLHDADREIQPTIGNPLGSDEQQDRNHRLSISYQQNNRYGFLKAGGGFVDDEIVFNSSPSHVQRWIAFVNHQFSLDSDWNIQTSIDWNHIIGRIKEYGHKPEENRVDAALSIQREFNRLKVSANFRKPFITDMTPPLLPYLGVDYTLVRQENQQLQVSANASKNYRAPTLNDRYWEDAGNVDLLPEKSYAGEFGFSWKYHSVKISSTTFYQLVDEWILWSPDEFGQYRPDNVKKVKVRGFEAQAEQQFNSGYFSQSVRIAYQFTKSTTEEANEAEAASIGKQLIYTPLHTASAFVLSGFKNWSAGIFVQYSGKRFTEASNSSVYELAPYLLTDLSLGKTVMVGRHVFSGHFVIKNVFDVEYQQYSSRAMPGRNFNIQISYQLNHKQE